MFYKYEIINSTEGDLLYLYLTMKYEFSSEFTLENEKDLGRRTKNFIVMNQIPFHGNKVYLVVDGIVTKAIDIGDIQPTILLDNQYSMDYFMVNLELDDNSICEISLREYLTSILFSYYQAGLHDEVYKAIGVLFNTYAYYMMSENKPISTNNIFANYKHLSYYQEKYSDYSVIYHQFQEILSSIDCLYLTYQNQYILPFIHYSNDGKTLSNSDYPYLSSVKSLWDLASPYYVEIHDITFDEIYKKTGLLLNKSSSIEIKEKKHTKMLIIDNNIFTLEEFKQLFSLKSSNIFLIVYNNYLRVITKGCGNSYGLSIFGSLELAKNGMIYSQIIKYYFPKVKLFRYIKERDKN